MAKTKSEPLAVVGVSEVSELLGVGLSTTKNWTRRNVLPPPDVQLACGPIWREATIKRWARGAGKERVLRLQML